MLKIIIAVSLLISAGSGWFYLDYLNKQEQAAALELRQSLESARASLENARVQAILAAKAAHEAQLNAELQSCLETAPTLALTPADCQLKFEQALSAAM